MEIIHNVKWKYSFIIVIIFVHDVELFFFQDVKIFFHDVEIFFRMWKYGTDTIANSEFLLYSSLIEMLEFDDDVFAAGNFFTQFFFLVLVVVWGFRSRKRKMWLSENFRSKWLPLKCVLKAIDRGQEAIEWTGFFGSRSIRDPFSRCEIHFVNSVLQLSPFSQQLALYSQRTPLLADSQCIHSLFLIWISFAKDCQLVTLTHSHSLFLLLHQWWVTENMESLFKSNQIIAWIKNKCFKRWRISFWCFILKHCNVERLPLLNCESSI